MGLQAVWNNIVISATHAPTALPWHKGGARFLGARVLTAVNLVLRSTKFYSTRA